MGHMQDTWPYPGQSQILKLSFRGALRQAQDKLRDEESRVRSILDFSNSGSPLRSE